MSINGTVFISYVKEDAKIAMRIYRDLRGNKIDAWIDSECLKPGSDWSAEIQRVIDDSRYFILVVSRTSVYKIGHYQAETKAALKKLERFPFGNVFIIPVRVEEVEISHPDIRKLHIIDLFPYKQGMRKILQHISINDDKLAKQGEALIRKLTTNGISPEQATREICSLLVSNPKLTQREKDICQQLMHCLDKGYARNQKEIYIRIGLLYALLEGINKVIDSAIEGSNGSSRTQAPAGNTVEPHPSVRGEPQSSPSTDQASPSPLSDVTPEPPRTTSAEGEIFLRKPSPSFRPAPSSQAPRVGHAPRVPHSAGPMHVTPPSSPFVNQLSGDSLQYSDLSGFGLSGHIADQAVRSAGRPPAA
ncbi:toll/interleukin-1 receptor domain-containing protein [Defluviicoccus vanus]|uniref:TIR domain-containing protein n=1 Tax=Defluviicoccus vanus TaxID=111831 RepID=A0A7H1MZ41_9PROT|nr:toll/interleukin-1 receptor domain-containing protein [Defluviicoccus vanus]QNT68727.1 TIR domain-containing protein [Defluviicoccus vanus]